MKIIIFFTFFITQIAFAQNKSNDLLLASSLNANNHLSRLNLLDVNFQKVLASNNYVSKKVLGQLLNSKSIEVKRSLAYNLNSSGEILHKLTTKRYKKLYRLVAGHPNTLPKTLSMLSKANDPVVREIIACRKDISPKILDNLVADSNKNVRIAVASNSKTSKISLEKLAMEFSDEIIFELVSNPNISYTIEQLIINKYPDEISSLVKNFGVSQKTFIELSKLPKYWLDLARSECTPLDILHNIVSKKDSTVNIVIANRAKLHLETFDLLYEEQNPAILYNLALNSSTPENILEKLFTNHYSLDIVTALSQNKGTPSEILEVLSRIPMLKKYIAKNSGSPNSVLKRLVREAKLPRKNKQDTADLSLISLIIENTATTSSLLEKIYFTYKDTHGIEDAFVKNRNTPTKILSLILEKHKIYDRLLVKALQHPNATKQLQEKFLGNLVVQAYFSKNPVLLNTLANTKNRLVILGLSCNENTPIITLENLIHYNNELEFKSNIVNNYSVPIPLLFKYPGSYVVQGLKNKKWTTSRSFYYKNFDRYKDFCNY